MDEFEACVLQYRESWEKARLTAAAMGVQIPLAWDGENTTPAKYNAKERQGAAASLSAIMRKRKDKACLV